MSGSKRETTRYAKTIIDADEWLRKTCANGTRRQVTWKDIAEALNVTNGAASSALAYLSRVEGSGLTRVNKGQGTYEFARPKEHPQQLVELRGSLRQVIPEVKMPVRKNLMTEFLAWFNDLPPGQMFTTGTAAEALDVSVGSAGNCVRRVAEHGGAEHLHGNLYKKAEQPLAPIVVDSMTDLQAELMKRMVATATAVDDDDEGDSGLATWTESTDERHPRPGYLRKLEDQALAGERVEPEDEAEEQPHPRPLAPTPMTVARAIERTRGRMSPAPPPWDLDNSGTYTYLTDNKKGDPLVRHPDGRIGVWHEL